VSNRAGHGNDGVHESDENPQGCWGWRGTNTRVGGEVVNGTHACRMPKEPLQDKGPRSRSTHLWRLSGAGHRRGGCNGGVRSVPGESARAAAEAVEPRPAQRARAHKRARDFLPAA